MHLKDTIKYYLFPHLFVSSHTYWRINQQYALCCVFSQNKSVHYSSLQRYKEETFSEKDLLWTLQLDKYMKIHFKNKGEKAELQPVVARCVLWSPVCCQIVECPLVSLSALLCQPLAQQGYTGNTLWSTHGLSAFSDPDSPIYTSLTLATNCISSSNVCLY